MAKRSGVFIIGRGPNWPRILANWLRWHRFHKPKPKPKPAPAPTPAPAPKPVRIHMYDDVNVPLIPKDAVAVAGYIGGKWPTYKKVVDGWPHAKHLSIAVASGYDADCLDVEPGDAPPSLAASWVRRQLAHRKTGVKYNTPLPVVYTSAAAAAVLLADLTAAGLHYGKDYLWWSAHYNPALGEHLCGPKCGFGIKVTAHATQYTDHALGRSLDESICTPAFFGG